MNTKITKVGEHSEGVEIPNDFLRYLELIPGAEVEIKLDKKNNWILIRPLHGEDFIEHFRDAVESMA